MTDKQSGGLNRPEQMTGFLSQTKKHEKPKEKFRKSAFGERGRIVFHCVYLLTLAAAVMVLIVVLTMPVFRIYGTSMDPTLMEGDFVICAKGRDLRQGDLVVFNYENKILVRRYIAGPGQWVDIDGDGNVYVDNELLEEPYLTEKALGTCDIEFPCQVPEGQIFCLGDHRSVSVDSRSAAVGCIADEQIVGKIVVRVWPLADFGAVNEKGW